MPKDIWTEIDKVVSLMTLEELVDQTPTPQPTPEPDPSEQTVKNIVEKLQHPAEHNGYLGIARSEGVSCSTVKLVQKAVEKRLAELAPDPEPIP